MLAPMSAATPKPARSPRRSQIIALTVAASFAAMTVSIAWADDKPKETTTLSYGKIEWKYGNQSGTGDSPPPPPPPPPKPSFRPTVVHPQIGTVNVRVR